MAIMLSTTDNPFDPFTQFEEWQAFDESMGYYTNNYLARVVKTSSSLSLSEQATELENAINEIVELNVLGIYKKVTKEEKKEKSGIY